MLTRLEQLEAEVRRREEEDHHQNSKTRSCVDKNSFELIGKNEKLGHSENNIVFVNP